MPSALFELLLQCAFLCPSCDSTCSGERFPFCALCARAIRTALRPQTLQLRDPDLSVSFLYSLQGRAYDVLKSWKKRSGQLLENAVFEELHHLLPAVLRVPVDGIVPIPQDPVRAWRLRGSPALRIARRIAPVLDAPILPILRRRHSSAPRRRQAERSRWERLQAQDLTLDCELQERDSLRGKRILLVDDFMTTGRTLQSHAALLEAAGAQALHAFVLGHRPSLRQEALSGWSERGGGATGSSPPSCSQPRSRATWSSEHAGP